MPFVVGPTTITGAPFTVEPPASSGIQARNFDRVVLANASPYLLRLADASNQGWLSPFTVNLFPYDPNGPTIQVTPALQGVVVAGNPSQLTAEFYRPDESLDNRTYPAPVALFSTINAFSSSTLLANAAVVNNVQLGPFDVSQFNSYQLRVQWLTGTIDTFATIRMNWLTNAVSVDQQLFKIISSDSLTLASNGLVTIAAAGGGSHFFTDRCRGDSLVITPVFATGTMQVQLLGSSRQSIGLRTGSTADDASKNLLLSPDAGLNIVSGGASGICWAPMLCPGPAELRVGQGVAKYQVILYMGSVNGITLAKNLPYSVDFIQEILLPRAPVGVQIVNNDTVNSPYIVSLVGTSD